MNSEILDVSEIIHRYLERAAQNLSIEKLLIQLHLDPSNITFEAIVHRMIEVAIASINIPNMFAP